MLTCLCADSPHSSDDEETAALKQRLRNVREEKRLNERKKFLLRQVLEEEERGLRTVRESRSHDFS